MLKRARNISHDNDVIPIAHQQNSTEGSPNQHTHEKPAQEAVIFDCSQIVEAVDEVQHSAATAHFFSAENNNDILQIPTNIAENSARVYNQLYKGIT